MHAHLEHVYEVLLRPLGQLLSLYHSDIVQPKVLRHRHRIHADRSIVVRERRYRDCVRHVDDRVLRCGGAEGWRCVLQHLAASQKKRKRSSSTFEVEMRVVRVEIRIT